MSKRKSVEFHRLAGSFKPSRHTKTGLSFPPSDGKSPRWLSKAARQQWKNLVPFLLESGTLTDVDTVALATLCESIAAYLDAKRMVEEQGQIVWIEATTRNGGMKKPIVNPAVALMNTHQKSILAVCSRYGLTPYDRERIEGIEQIDDTSKQRTQATQSKTRRYQLSDGSMANGDENGPWLQMPGISWKEV